MDHSSMPFRGGGGIVVSYTVIHNLLFTAVTSKLHIFLCCFQCCHAELLYTSRLKGRDKFGERDRLKEIQFLALTSSLQEKLVYINIKHYRHLPHSFSV